MMSDRLTEFDYACNCYKLKPEKVGNAVQMLGSLEDKRDKTVTVLEKFDSDEKYTVSEAIMRLRDIWG